MRSGAKVQTTAVLLLTGCSGAPSTLEPVGPRGQLIAEMWWITFGASMAVFVLVMAALGYALVRRRAPEIEARLQNDPKSWVSEPSRIANNRFVLAGGVALPVIVLTPILVYTFVSLGALAVPATPVAFPIEVIGHQYWWSVRYPSRGFVTANEVRVPIGQPIELRLSSSDVIHSFWVPQVMGKHDMTPGHVNTTWIQVDKPGVYWGECTEFCGLQHAKMAFVLVAQTQSEFDAWAAGQQRPAAESIDPQVLRGAQVFARDGCIRCHTVRQGGAAVGGDLGPDLTHVASRLTLGAGILANNRGNLAGWTANPQALKPGNYMPVTYLDAESLLAVVAYLESLK